MADDRDYVSEKFSADYNKDLEGLRGYPNKDEYLNIARKAQIQSDQKRMSLEGDAANNIRRAPHRAISAHRTRSNVGHRTVYSPRRPVRR